MLIERLEDSGITVHGDNSNVSQSVQRVADTVLSLLPRMNASMVVSVSRGSLHLYWAARGHSLEVSIDTELSTTVTGKSGDYDVILICPGESSDLARCVEAALELYQTSTVV
jgi:predicted RNA-binding protein Jag